MNREELILALLARWATVNPNEATNPGSLADYRDQIARNDDATLQAMWNAPRQAPGSAQDPNKIIAFAQSQVGKRYAGPIIGEADAARWGDPGFDCSSFVASAYRQLGVNLTPFTDTAAKETTKIDPSQAQPGDVIFYRYNDPSQPGVSFPHMGIYAGNGQMIDASVRGGVQTRPLLNQPFEIHRVPGVEPMQATYGPPAPAGTAQGPARTPSGRIQFSPYDDVFLKYMPQDLAADDTFRAIVAAATKAESGWDPNKVGGAGELGIFQLHPDGAGKGMGDARRDPDTSAHVMLPKFADAYRRVKQLFPNATGPHLAALVAGMAERPQGTDPNGILSSNSPAYGNYTAAWGDVASGAGSAARPYTGATKPTVSLPAITGDMLSTPNGVVDAIHNTWAAAIQQTDGLDPFMDAAKIKAIMDAAKAQTDVLTWVQDRADKLGQNTVVNEIARGHLALGQQQLAQSGQQFGQTLAQQRDFHNDDVRLAMLKLAQGDQQFAATHALAIQTFELNNRQVGANITGVDPVTGLETEATRQGRAALTGDYNGQPTLAARTLEETIKAHEDTLRAGYAQHLADSAKQEAAARAEAEKLRAAAGRGRAVADASGQYVSGWEPGGQIATIRQGMGLPFQPMPMAGLTSVNPDAGLDELRAALARSAAAYPQPQPR